MVQKVLYPAYFDAECTRGEGRRVPQGMAVPEPTVDELATAVGQVGYDAIVERDVAYSREHWMRRGRVLVNGADDATKTDLLQAVAAYITALRE
ncbi:MAG: signal recognition particle subunit SRP19 [Halobacteriaceae archaeon]